MSFYSGNQVIVTKKSGKSGAGRQKIPEKTYLKPFTAAIYRISDIRRECLQKVLRIKSLQK